MWRSRRQRGRSRPQQNLRRKYEPNDRFDVEGLREEVDGLDAFDGVAAVAEFLDHAGANNDERDQPERKTRHRRAGFAAVVVRDRDNDAGDDEANDADEQPAQQRSADPLGVSPTDVSGCFSPTRTITTSTSATSHMPASFRIAEVNVVPGQKMFTSCRDQHSKQRDEQAKYVIAVTGAGSGCSRPTHRFVILIEAVPPRQPQTVLLLF